MAAPNVTALNGSALLVQWAPPFSPTSPLVSYQLRVSMVVPSGVAVAAFVPTYNTLTAYQYALPRRDNTSYSFALYAANLDFPLPPITTPLLYSPPVTSASAPPTLSNASLLLSPPLPSNWPNSYLTQGNNITLLVDFPVNSSTAGPLSLTAPLQALALFYSTDGGGNWTFVPSPLWNVPIQWANLQGTITNLAANTYWFKSMASNIAGGSNSSASPSGVAIGASPPSTAPAPALGPNASSSTSSAAGGTGASGGGGQQASAPGLGNATGASAVSSVSAATSAMTAASSVSQLPPPPATASATSVSTGAGNGTAARSGAASSTAAGAARLSSSSGGLSSSATSVGASSREGLTSAGGGVGTSTAAGGGGGGGGSVGGVSSASSTPPSGPMSITDGSSRSDSLIAGIIIGVFVSLALLCTLTYCCFCSQAARRKRQTPPQSQAPSGVASPRPSPGLAPVPLAGTGVGDEKGVGAGARRGRRVAGRYPPYDDVELATVDAEWSEEEDGLHQMRLPPAVVSGPPGRR